MMLTSKSNGTRIRTSFVTLVLGLFMVSPVQAFAHGGLKGSLPKANEVVTGQLRELRLDFVEKPELAVTSIRLTNHLGEVIGLSRLRLDTSSIVVRITDSLRSGRYHVQWKTAGRDGHPVSGDFFFEIAGPTTMAPAETHHDTLSLPASASFNAESPAYVGIRFVQFIALTVLLGAFAFWHGVLRLLRRREGNEPVLARIKRRHERLAVTAAVVLLVIGAIRLVAQSYAMHGADESVFSPMIPMTTGTRWGIGWVLQIAGSSLVIAGLLLARGNQKDGWNVATLGALSLAFSPAFSGHAASAPHLSALAVLSDALHVIGAGGWIGSLFFVIAVGIPGALTLGAEQRGAAVSAIVNAFSPTALMFAAIVAGTGVFAGWLHIGSIRGLFETTYGRTLIVKVGILSLLAVTGAYNWLLIKPALGKSDATTRLRRTASAELAIAVLVLAVTAILVATPTAIDEELS